MAFRAQIDLIIVLTVTQNILLVGGFAESRYLDAELRRAFGELKIKLERPATS